MQDYWRKQVILITGGTGDIGRELVKHFAGLGAKVAVNYLENSARAEELLGEVKSPNVRLYRADVGKESEVEDAVTQIEKDFGPVTILVNNAGFAINNLLITMKAEEWLSMMNTHLNGTFYCTRRVLRSMLANRFGRIVNISSISAVQGAAGLTHYASAKAAVIAFSKSLAKEVGTKGVTCNAVALNLLHTENPNKRVKPEVFQRIIENSPLGRVGKPSEVVHAIEYLAGANSGLMTGQLLTL